ncbi:MAG TPA: hypothetical protein VHP56_01270 [Solirubrobacterales bacterium]|jgi:hypothetical protein|nr:hypothetical protein [Solirubrobacterales bacterium]
MSEIETVRRPQAIEPCEECGAPMDPQQRYCVNCAARRGNGANPASRYFATMSKRSRRPLTGPPPKQSPTSRAAAVAFFALLPLAVGLGLVIGRSGSGNDNSDALLQALRERPAATAGTVATPGAAATAQKAKKDAKGGKGKSKGAGKVTHTENGDVHDVANFEASKRKEEEDTQIVAENPEQTGDDYIKAQQNLPDVIVVGGEGGGSAPAPSGVEP